MRKPVSIAIDGPAGAGKSTIARRVASHLGILYLDTGAMYRAIGLKSIRTGTDMRDEQAMQAMLDQTSLEIIFKDGTQRVMLDGQDVTDDLRTPPVSRAASDVSALPVVRYRLVELQRRIAGQQDLVLDGRDIGTFVLPDATFKFYLTADPAERARRRLHDLEVRGDASQTFEQVLADVMYRDKQDSERSLAPLRQAEDAIRVDSTGLEIEEVVACFLRHIGQNLP